MKRLSLWILLMITIGFAIATVSWSDGSPKKGFMMIKSNEFGDFQRPPVAFNHTLHENKFLCKECHHNNDIFLDNTNRKSAVCSSCHKVEKTDDVQVPLANAFHMKCKSCHKKSLKRNRTAGPVMCGSCHIK